MTDRPLTVYEALTQMVALAHLHNELSKEGLAPEVRWGELAEKLEAALSGHDEDVQERAQRATEEVFDYISDHPQVFMASVPDREDVKAALQHCIAIIANHLGGSRE